MANHNNRRKKKRKGRYKYMFRRLFLLVLIIGIIGGAGWLAWGKVSEAFGESTGGDPPAAEADEPADPQDGDDPAEDPETPVEEEPPAEPAVQVEEPQQEQEWNLILVNATSPLPEDFEVEELEVVNEYRVDARIAPDLKRMFAKAKEDGINLMLCSAYRTVELQTTNFENKKQEYMSAGMSEEEAIATTATIIAVPGTSEHHTGLAVDIVTPEYQTLDEGFAETGAFRWLDQNAADFGFVLRFPKDKERLTGIIYEPWHYRYVGLDHAPIMKANGYCLEEYVYVLEQEQLAARQKAAAAVSAPADSDEEDDEDEWEEAE